MSKKSIPLYSTSLTLVIVLLSACIIATFLSSLVFTPSNHFLYQAALGFSPVQSDNRDNNNPNSSSDQSALGTSFLTYVSQNYGERIRIQYPSNISHFESQKDPNCCADVTFVSMPYLTNIHIQKGTASGVAKTYNLQSTSLEEIANALVEQEKRYNPATMLSGQIPPSTKLSPTVETLQYNYTQPDASGVELDHSVYLIKHNDNFVFADYFRPATHLKLYQTFINMIKSLEFIK